MFGFDGNFKNKRPINIGGRPVTLSKDQLLEKNKLERLERERIRLSNLSASKIQSFYRNRSKLKKEFNLERSNWSSPKTITQIPSALSQLESFYNIVLDRQKLLDILELININKQFLDSLWSLKDVYLVANWTLCLKRLVVLSTPLIFFNSTVVFLEQMIDSIGSVLNLNLYRYLKNIFNPAKIFNY
ncbi:hypothetical protein BC833DRAFT_387837 [Globomyces pollinis-pini]|nr:hypothetical protein BC833DRAFT_387837 [Globomyces pollinis-pini]